MGALQLTVIYLILLLTSQVISKEEQWKSATATYTKEMDGSIITEGACGYGDLHKASYGKYSAGLSTMLFNRGSTCGACFELRCVDHILWCLQGSPSVILTATDFCPPNYGLSADYGGWCNFPKEHFEMSEAAFAPALNHCWNHKDLIICKICVEEVYKFKTNELEREVRTSPVMPRIQHNSQKKRKSRRRKR